MPCTTRFLWAYSDHGSPTISMTFYQKDDNMTAADYKARRTALGHTQQSLADVLKLDRVTIARRETGKLPITAEAALAILKLSKTRK